MNRTLTFLVVACGAATHVFPQDPPAAKPQIRFKAVLYSTPSDLWEDVREVDPSFKAIGAEVFRLAKGLEADAVGERHKASAALKSLGLPAFGAIKEERDRTPSDRTRLELDRILIELAGDWPGYSSLYPQGRPPTRLEEDVLRAAVARLAKGLEADDIEVRGKAAGALVSMGLAAFGAIKEERDRTRSEQVRQELDGILKELAGLSPVVPMGRVLENAEGQALGTRLAERKLQVRQQPFMTLKDGVPGSVFVGDEIPAGDGKRRMRLDGDGRRLRLVEKEPAGTLKFGFQMLVTATVSEEDRNSVSLDIAITDTHFRRPIREIETPLGRVSNPDVIEIGVDLSPVLKSGGHFLAGPFPAAAENEAPWWILLEIDVIGK